MRQVEIFPYLADQELIDRLNNILKKTHFGLN